MSAVLQTVGRGHWMLVLLALYVFLLPLTPDYVGISVPGIMPLNGSRLLSLIALPILALMLCREGGWGWRRLARPLPVVVAIFWLVVGATPYLSTAQITVTSGIRDGFVFGLDTVLPCLVLLAAVRDPARARAVVIALAAAGLVLVGFAAHEFATGSNPFVGLRPVLPGEEPWTNLQPRCGLPRVEASFGHPLSLGRYLAMLAPLVMWVSATAPSRNGRWGFALAAAALATGVLLTLSVGPLVSLALGVLLVAATRRAAYAPTLVLLALGGALAFFGTPVSANLRGALGACVEAEAGPSGEVRRNLEFRVTVYQLARHGLETSPWIGFGTYGNIPVLMPNQDIINTYVVYLLKHGLVGLLAFLAVCAAFLATVAHALRREGPARSLALVLGATMIAQLVLLFGVSPVGPGERMFWVLVGLAGALQCRRALSASPVDAAPEGA